MEIKSIITGFLSLDGGAMFGVVPKVIWEKLTPADEKNRIELAMRVLLIKDGKKNILIDVGAGNKDSAKFKKIFNLRPKDWLRESLQQEGLRPEDITDIIMTHLHFDHGGGLTEFDKDGKLKPTFENAKVYVQKKNWENAIHPNRKDKASFIPQNFMPIFDSGKFEFLSGPEELFKGIKVISGDNHSHGHQIVRLEDNKGITYYCGDLIPTKAHIRIPYVMGYDLYPMNAMADKEKLLDQAVKEDASLIFEHDPLEGESKVRRDGDDFSLMLAE